MKLKSFLIFLLVLVIVGTGIYTAFMGLKIGDFSIESVKDSMKLGLDIKGGAFVVLEADTDATGKELKDIMEQTKEVITRRIDAMGLTEPNIVLEGEKRIRIELPGVKDAQDAIDSIGKTAQLKFVKSNGELVITGNEVKNAKLGFSPETGEPVVSLELNSQGTKAFQVATKELAILPDYIADPNNPEKKINNIDKIIHIVLDNEIISSPKVNDEIPNGKAIISGNFTPESASRLAALIRGGSLPVDLIEKQTSAIGPTLGIDSLKTSLDAAKIGILLVLLFMLLYYRVPGLVADIALAIYILIVVFALVGLDATLTLPGVAGLILGIGMAVDANVIIFERLKEELRNGKTIRSSIDSGFSKALRTILDANITTFIAAIVLYYFGLGPIKGFAVTLMIGILASMFTAVFVTKFLLKLIVKMDIFKNIKLFGA
ncbi:protein translocase subunit SecD [Paramaledivibacter caminithermalis]|uniref:Protein translocase subunit SecD n=1 Tax=Paramaledivibacter caminithermalis (strain DSM 15212 / CIP 107654 / DViRD3) TaxID=1121301 RepID=A0A1M6JWZ3_PARC5|nr:protein translocase subunit SecD [Paramaledivibacter caminithermalis]SHJ51200.1 preprotein translocase subunit SecD [Paramaledivibacter caminithermalis DSM 15212]